MVSRNPLSDSRPPFPRNVTIQYRRASVPYPLEITGTLTRLRTDDDVYTSTVYRRARSPTCLRAHAYIRVHVCVRGTLVLHVPQAYVYT